MKKLIAIVMMMLAVIMVGCSNQHKPDKQTEELCEAQTEYCRLLKLQYNALNNEPKKANKIQKRVEDTFNTIFYGNDDERFYHEAGDDMG